MHDTPLAGPTGGSEHFGLPCIKKQLCGDGHGGHPAVGSNACVWGAVIAGRGDREMRVKLGLMVLRTRYEPKSRAKPRKACIIWSRASLCIPGLPALKVYIKAPYITAPNARMPETKRASLKILCITSCRDWGADVKPGPSPGGGIGCAKEIIGVRNKIAVKNQNKRI